MRLEVEAVDAGHGGVRALHGVSVTVDPGECVALLGANGAGKSSLLDVVAGRLRPDSGRVLLGGEDVTGLAVRQRAGRGLALVPEGRPVFAGLTVAENLEVGGWLPDPVPTAEVLESFPALQPLLDRRAGDLSGGQQQMVVLARALRARPKVLLLDEPSVGLAPSAVEALAATVRGLVAAGTAVLLVEQDVSVALSVASRGLVLESGRVVLTGTAAELRADPSVSEAYLGGR